MARDASLFSLAFLFLNGALHAQELVPVEIETTPALVEADRLHFRADYLYWWLARLQTPPLLTSGPAGSSAMVGEPGTSILRGGEPITSRHGRYVGVRGGLDYWFGQDRRWGVELDAFFMERDSTHYTVFQGDVPVLGIPYVDGSGRNHSFVVSGFNSDLGNLLGSTRIYSRMELFGEEANLFYNLARNEQSTWNIFAGLRFLQLRERLDLTSSANILPAKSTLLGLEDHFQTFDKFYGAQIGGSGTLRAGRWSIEGRAAVAFGANDERIQNKGEFIHATPQQRLSLPQGLFVQPGNEGSFERFSFNVVSEARLTIACDVTRWLNVHAGYSLLTWSGPVRPGSQVVAIDRTPTQSNAGTSQPTPQFKEEFFWAHGLNAGLAIRW